jgi:sugar/nucleoside kinase (ribokinase family)
MKKVLTIGGATHDIFILYESLEVATFSHNEVRDQRFLLLQEGKKIEVKSIKYASGGGATNSAVSFKRLGFDVSSLFKLGIDHPAEIIRAALTKEGINLSFVAKGSKGSTGTSFILPTPSGDRTILAFRGINAYMQQEDIPFASLNTFDQLYITSLSGRSSELLLPIVKKAKEFDVPVAINPGGSQLAAGAHTLRDALQFIDLLILNAEEAEMFFSHIKSDHRDRFSLDTFFKTVMQQGPSIVVVTDGARGVYVAHKNIVFFYPAIQEVKIVNTIGAGDAFGSCFVASLLQGFSIQEAIMCGNINAASVISYLDAKEGLLSAEKLLERLQKIDKSLLRQKKL